MDKKKNMIIGALIVGMAVFLLGCAPAAQQDSEGASVPSGIKATIFKSPGCGCCDVYSQYMGKEGYAVDMNTVDNMGEIKRKLNVPPQLQSCHTSEIEGYFVEGHVPNEAIAKLLAEKPDIAGIALPGMPSGSPGMPGKKSGTWVIYAVQHDGSYTEFMRG